MPGMTPALRANREIEPVAKGADLKQGIGRCRLLENFIHIDIVGFLFLDEAVGRVLIISR
jgi:hypothetical protein